MLLAQLYKIHTTKAQPDKLPYISLTGIYCCCMYEFKGTLTPPSVVAFIYDGACIYMLHAKI